jgi:hypothetical protein
LSGSSVGTGTGTAIIVHSRDAKARTLDILNKEYPSGYGVIHATLRVAAARQFLDMGFYISIPGTVTYKSAAGVRDVVRFAPVDRLLAETDPFPLSRAAPGKGTFPPTSNNHRDHGQGARRKDRELAPLLPIISSTSFSISTKGQTMKPAIITSTAGRQLHQTPHGHQEKRRSSPSSGFLKTARGHGIPVISPATASWKRTLFSGPHETPRHWGTEGQKRFRAGTAASDIISDKRRFSAFSRRLTRRSEPLASHRGSGG